ncbi:MAG: hypothetical protein ACI849_000252, partial [Patiriisocius sp.]
MNPSAQDWVKKILSTYQEDAIILQHPSRRAFYIALKDTGFLYGDSYTLLLKHDTDLKLTHEECTKVNLFHALQYIGSTHMPNASPLEVISSIVKYYKALDKGKKGFLHAFTFSTSETTNLEHILAKRVQDSNTVYKTNAVSLLTHALLFIDVLAYEYWLSGASDTKEFIKKLEQQTIVCCFSILKSKHTKNKYDRLLIELFEASSQYISSKGNFETTLSKENFVNYTESAKQYLFDLSCLAVWEDKTLDTEEYTYLKELNNNLGFDESKMRESIDHIKAFSLQSEKKVTLFEYATPIKQFYKQSTSTVQRLIIRNKDRLQKELHESGELLKLLGSSTHRELSQDEKSKVKEQLLDICKSIPSLTIFLLPGGTILLPLLVKFIPKLLPSSFDE